MSNLPFDLLFVIFSKLSMWELRQCMPVCRAWYLVSSAKYFEEVHLIGNKNNEQLLRLSEITRVDGSKLGDYVKRLYFDLHYDEYEYLDEHSFQRLLFNFPQLQKISIREEYTKHVMNIPQLKLMQIRNVTLYNYCERQSLIETQFVTNQAPKNQTTTSPRLTSLLWPNVLDIDCRNAMNRLFDLKTLSKLKIEIHSRQIPNREKINLSNVLSVCGDLESLEIRTAYNWKIEEKTRHTNLESLMLSVMELTEEHIDYITDYIPNLRYLELTLYQSTLEYDLIRLKPATIDKFATYLRRMKTLDIVPYSEPWLLSRQHPSIAIQQEAFWRFVRVLCEDECYCNLSANTCIAANSPVYSFIFKKDKIVYISCCILLDFLNCDYWIEELRGLTFESLKISNSKRIFDFNRFGRKLDMEQDGYSYLIEPLLTRLSQQKHKNTSSIEIRNLEQELCFKHHKEIGSKKRFDGTIVKMKLTNNLLECLSQVYPDVRLIDLKNCPFEKADPNTNIYDLDLSCFESIQELVLDAEKIFARRKARRPLYIQFIDASTPDTYDYYHYDEKRSKSFYYLGKQKELSVPKKIYLVKIYHKGITEFKFRRRGRHIPATTTTVNSNE